MKIENGEVVIGDAGEINKSIDKVTASLKKTLEIMKMVDIKQLPPSSLRSFRSSFKDVQEAIRKNILIPRK